MPFKSATIMASKLLFTPLAIFTSETVESEARMVAVADREARLVAGAVPDFLSWFSSAAELVEWLLLVAKDSAKGSSSSLSARDCLGVAMPFAATTTLDRLAVSPALAKTVPTLFRMLAARLSITSLRLTRKWVKICVPARAMTTKQPQRVKTAESVVHWLRDTVKPYKPSLNMNTTMTGQCKFRAPASRTS